jgi:hypothetical protein
MKIFAMNDCDWMAAEDLESAKAAYLKDYSGDYDSLEDPHELTEEEMDSHTLHDPEGENPDCTFREGLAAMLGHFREYLEEEINGELIPVTTGDYRHLAIEPRDPAIRQRLKVARDRRLECETYQKILAEAK